MLSRSHWCDLTTDAGLSQVLKERGIGPPPDVNWNLDCHSKALPPANDCCWRHALMAQPDFAEQESALEMKVKQAGHIVEYCPKFHCECNFIERYWSAAKRAARNQCNYNFTSLWERLPGIHDEVSMIEIRNHARTSCRYIKMYSKGKDGVNAEKVERDRQKMKAHRRLCVKDWFLQAYRIVNRCLSFFSDFLMALPYIQRHPSFFLYLPCPVSSYPSQKLYTDITLFFR